MRKCWKIVIITSSVVLGLVLFITLMAVSFKTIESDELGIKYNHVTRSLDDTRVYQQGRYALQPDNGQLCLTNDGLQLTLDITYQYKLNQDSLVNFFKTYGTDYEDVIRLLTWAAVRDTCGDWASDGFYYSREIIEQQMFEGMTNNLAVITVAAGFLQLTDVEFPDDFQYAVGNVTENMQDATQATNERALNITNAQTQLLQAQQSADILMIQANANASVIQVSAIASAEGITAQLAAQASVYLSVMQSLNFTPEDLVNYISLQTIENAQNSVVGVESPAYFSFTAQN